MTKKLLTLLIEEIKEQGFGRYFTDVVSTSGQKLGDIKSIDFNTKKQVEVLIQPPEEDSDNEESYNKESNNEETYGFQIGTEFPGCVDQRKVCYGGINGNWAGSMTRALQMASWLKGLNFTPGSQKRNKKNAASGNESNHWKGSTNAYGVDLPCNREKGDSGWKKLRDEFVSRGWMTKDRMSDTYLERGKGQWINFEVGNYKYQVGWNVADHYDHIHVGVRCLDISKVNITNPLKDKIKIDKEDKEGDDVLNSGGLSVWKTAVFGGIGYATPEWMKSQWVSAGLSSDRAVFLSYTSVELSTVKKNNKIDKIVGFSAGGSKVWDEIINNSSDYKFIGLIDPSTSEFQFEKYKNGGLPSVVKSLSNHSNWKDYPNTKKILKYLEDKNVLTKTNLAHKSIPLEFFKKYKKELS